MCKGYAILMGCGRVINYECKRIWKVVVTCLEPLLKHLLVRTVENHEAPQLGYPVLGHYLNLVSPNFE